MKAVAPLLFGVAFGLALDRAELTRRARVTGVFCLSDPTMLKFLLAALSTGAFLVQAALSLGLVTSVPVPPTLPVANLVGGVLFGSAMAGAGFCSGTIFAAVGSGRRGLLAGFGGLLVGGVIMDGAGAPLVIRLRGLGPRLDTTIAGLAGLSGWLVVLALVGVSLFAFYLVERR